MKKRKSLMLGCVLVVVALASYVYYCSAIVTTDAPSKLVQSPHNSEGSAQGMEFIPALGPIDIVDPATAAKYNISGYLTIELSETSPKELSVREGEASIELLLKLVPFREDLTETEVTFNAKGPGLKIEVPYGDRLLCLNDLVSYDPNGTVKVIANQPLLVKMVLKAPADYPMISFPLHAVGITSSVPILDKMDVIANV